MIEPKSRAGTRTVPILAPLLPILAAAEPARAGQGLAFGRDADVAFSASTVHRRAERIWSKAGLDPVGLHECRHTYASLLIAAGANIKAVQVFMGHASITITLDRYGHLLPGAEGDAAALADAYLEAASIGPRGERGEQMGNTRPVSGGLERSSAATAEGQLALGLLEDSAQ